MCYAKDKSRFDLNGLARSEDQQVYFSNPDNDSRGPWNFIETKGEQLEGNRDTEYKRALLGTLSGAFRTSAKPATGLALSRDPFDFDAAVVLFDEIDARLPALIRGESVEEMAGEGE